MSNGLLMSKHERSLQSAFFDRSFLEEKRPFNWVHTILHKLVCYTFAFALVSSSFSLLQVFFKSIEYLNLILWSNFSIFKYQHYILALYSF